MPLQSEIMGPGDPSWLEHIRGAPDTLPYHLAHPEVSFGTHVKACKLALAREVIPKTRIYLDQKYWIHCRDAKLDRAQTVHVEIFRALRELVQRGETICPVAHAVLEETFKQHDRVTRAATAIVIEELSQNIAIEPFTELTRLELLRFIRSSTQGGDAVHAAEELAWTWPAWLFGVARPSNTPFDMATERAMAKAFFDAIIRMPFSAVVEAYGGARLESFAYDTEEMQRKRTEETRRHRHEFQTFKDVFLIEVAGGLDVLKEDLEGTMVHLYEATTGNTPTPEEVRASRATRPSLADLIYSAFKHGKVGAALPGIRIISGIHAAMRYRDQPHRKGDMHDHVHARIALPYCDMFLTEKNLGNLLTQPPLEYDKLYQCRVLWDDEKILEALKGLK